MKYVFLFLLLLTYNAQAANYNSVVAYYNAAGSAATDWTADGSLQALYYFESSGIADDSTANNNDLTCLNDPTCPDADTTNYIEGSQSASFTPAGTDKAYYIAQTSMSANYPANGSSTSAVTIAGWVRVTTLASSDFFFSIHDENLTKNIVTLSQTDAAGQITSEVNAATGTTTDTPTATMSVNTWYFLAVVYDSTNLATYIRVSGSSSSEFSTTAASYGNLDDMTSTGVAATGTRTSDASGQGFYGQIDAKAVFSRAFTQSELDGVFANGWDGDGW